MPRLKTYEVRTVQTSETILRVEAEDFEGAEYAAMYDPEECYLLEETVVRREVLEILEGD